jgi:hypothetical protein
LPFGIIEKEIDIRVLSIGMPNKGQEGKTIYGLTGDLPYGFVYFIFLEFLYRFAHSNF